MSIDIAICVKPVPELDKIQFDPTTKVIRRTPGESVLNPLDKNALELARQLKECTDCTITLVSMAPPSAEINLREALARGGDKVYHLSDRAFAGGDAFATSYTLSEALKQLGKFDLIITGEYSSDGGTNLGAAQIGEWMGMEHIHNVREFELTDRKFFAVSEADGKQICWKGTLPVLISVSRSINTPRAVGIREILAAKRKPYSIWTAKDIPTLNHNYIGKDGSPTHTGDMNPIESGRVCKVMKDDPPKLAENIIRILRETGINI